MSHARSRSTSPQQRAVFEFIRDRVCQAGVCPSFRDIARHFGIASLNRVTVHLRALERKGFIAQDRGRNRAIRILPREPSCLPLVGVVGAGPLSEAVEAVTPFEFDGALRDDGINAAVLVVDDSLKHQRIAAGDFLIGPRQGGRFQPRWLVRHIGE